MQVRRACIAAQKASRLFERFSSPNVAYARREFNWTIESDLGQTSNTRWNRRRSQIVRAAVHRERSPAGTTVGAFGIVGSRQDLLMKNFTAVIEQDADTGLYV